VSLKRITVAETPQFVRQAAEVWSDDQRESFVDFIAKNPQMGDVIPDTGGVRKIRWAKAGTGKRGGVRVIYFYHDADSPLLSADGLREGTPGGLDARRKAHRPKAG
jgi:mRNA-degrading endonuclease RelE of RelBE toxin-antitoxin system